MSAKVEADGQRSVQVEVEVAGSPELVWEAIASGPGISSWFVPTSVEEQVGGAITANFGPGMESTSTITKWNPPMNFAAEGSGMTPEAPPMATEWIVEGKAGGTCIVRIVHSWFASTDEWDGQFESVEQGWNAFFKILRLKLQHFPGQEGAAFDLAGMANGTAEEAWTALTSPFGLGTAEKGASAQSAPDAPALTGVVESVSGEAGGERHMMLLISKPSNGILHFFAMPMGGAVYASIRFFLFGSNPGAAVSQCEDEWKSWFTNRFPMG